MIELEIDFVCLHKNIRGLSELYIRLLNEIDTAAGHISQLDTFWDGEAGDAYIAKAMASVVCASAVAAKIRDAIKCLDEALSGYIQNENDIQRLIGSYR